MRQAQYVVMFYVVLTCLLFFLALYPQPSDALSLDEIESTYERERQNKKKNDYNDDEKKKKNGNTNPGKDEFSLYDPVDKEDGDISDQELEDREDREAEVPTNITGIDDYDASGNTYLVNAVLARSAKIVRNMLKGGADPNKPDAQGQTPLFIAAKEGSYFTVKELLKSPTINPNIRTNDGISPLLVAISANHRDVAALLLDHNADPNIGLPDGITPLMMACLSNQSETVVTLFKYNAIVDQTTFTGETALMYSVVTDIIEMVDLLIAHKANINQQNDFGYTPVMLAASRGAIKSLKRLLEAGADIEAQDFTDRTALEIIVDRSEDKEVINMLLMYGANHHRRQNLVITPDIEVKRKEFLERLERSRIEKQRDVKEL